MTEAPIKESLAEALDIAAYTMDKAYLGRLKQDYNALNHPKVNKQTRKPTDNIRLIKVRRWIKDSNESIIDCFRNVLGVFSSDKENNIALVIKRTSESVEMYFAISNYGADYVTISNNYAELLSSSLQGNFCGSEFEIYNGTENLLNDFFHYNDIKDEGIKAVSIVTGIPSAKSKEFSSQGIEKILEGIVPEEKKSYTIVILAEPLQNNDIHTVLNGFEELASSLSPFVSTQLNISENESKSEGENISSSITESIGEAVTKTHSVNISAGVTIGSRDVASANIGLAYGYSHGKTSSSNHADTKTTGTNYMITRGNGEATTYSFKSYPISDIIEKAEKNIKRIQNGSSEGIWRCASYVLSSDKNLCRNVSGSIASIFGGDESYVETPSSTVWSYYNKDDKINFENIIDSLNQFVHPCFVNKADKKIISASSYITTAELEA